MDYILIGLAVVILYVLLTRKPVDISGMEARLAELQGQAAHNAQVLDSVHRVEQTLAGTQARGAAGEQLLEDAIAALPPDWIIRDFRVGNKPVEFAIKLPNGLVLPLDSKWPAQAQLERLALTDDPRERQVLVDLINRAVLEKAKEVRKYIDPNLTMPFGIAAVPDTVYAVSTKAVHRALKANVVVLPYSMVLPYILLVIHTTTADRSPADLQRVLGHLAGIAAVLAQLQQDVEGRFSKGITMLTNSRDDFRVQLAKALSSLAAIDDE